MTAFVSWGLLPEFYLHPITPQAKYALTLVFSFYMFVSSFLFFHLSHWVSSLNTAHNAPRPIRPNFSHFSFYILVSFFLLFHLSLWVSSLNIAHYAPDPITPQAKYALTLVTLASTCLYLPFFSFICLLDQLPEYSPLRPKSNYAQSQIRHNFSHFSLYMFVSSFHLFHLSLGSTPWIQPITPKIPLRPKPNTP